MPYLFDHDQFDLEKWEIGKMLMFGFLSLYIHVHLQNPKGPIERHGISEKLRYGVVKSNVIELGMNYLYFVSNF